MYKVQRHQIGRFDAVRLVNELTHEYLEILTSFGAGINDFVIKNEKGQLVSVIEGYRTEKEVIHDHHTAFKGSKLSPFPNRIPEGKFTFDGKKYQLPVNEVATNNQLHAMLHCRPFDIVREVGDENGAELVLTYDYKGTDQGYPFPYLLTITYKLDASGVSVTTALENKADTTMPIGDGWHPYFRFENLNLVELQMGAAERLSSNVGNALSGEHGYKVAKIIGEESLDDCFEVNQEEKFSLQLKDSSNGIALEIWQESKENQYRYLQIYTPPTRQSIAVEPVSCVPNAFNTGHGLIVLKPNEKVSMSFGIKNILLNI
ncbi:hypothetical protein N7E81_09060 [Reichenbachiella carrageenanivorans]|uniref:Aldose 1-epimerase n=1 Tax=Reichenbachiella carrageenanivorans TaxID=2979869 RepID=A0ABY6D5X0_9BACT|nr:hypothetical protein [Reichenbachiella carrageenanivorans]UXX81244.1 hypothetical protein N7E81_09060 [Reichenbachiella carrageenanivorans]